MSVIQGYHPQFDIDLPFGKEAENYVARDLLGPGARIEVKRDRIAARTWRLYVEYAHHPKSAPWFVPSGILKTTATHWAFRIDTRAGPLTLFISVEALKAVVDELFLQGSLGSEQHGDCPTWGVLVPLERLLRATDGESACTIARTWNGHDWRNA